MTYTPKSPVTLTGDVTGVGENVITTTLNKTISSSSSLYYYGYSTATIVLGSSATAIPLNVDVRKDSCFAHSSTTNSNKITISAPGWYNVKVQAIFVPAQCSNLNCCMNQQCSCSCTGVINLYQNNVAVVGAQALFGADDGSTNDYMDAFFEVLINCATNDVLSLCASVSSGNIQTVPNNIRMIIKTC